MSGMSFLWEDFLTPGQDSVQQLDKCLPGSGERPLLMLCSILFWCSFMNRTPARRLQLEKWVAQTEWYQNWANCTVSSQAETQFWENTEIGILNDRC